MAIVVDRDLVIVERESPYSSSEEEEEEDYESPPERRSKRRRTTRKQTSTAPPKPPNAFILYSLETRPKLAEENKELSNAEISRLLGTSWRKLHPNEKKYP